MLAAGFLATGPILFTQTPPDDVPDRLRSALPKEVADKILHEVAVARGRQLPVSALEHRALEWAAKGMPPADIAKEITAQHRALWIGREALRAAGRSEPAEQEIEAAAVVLGKGVDSATVSALARSALAGRSLAVPLAVVSNLMERGLPAEDVIAAMHIWLEANANDTELQDLAGAPARPELSVIRVARTTQRPTDAAPPRRRPRSHQ